MPGRTGTGVSQDRTGQDADTDHSALRSAGGNHCRGRTYAPLKPPWLVVFDNKK